MKTNGYIICQEATKMAGLTKCNICEFPKICSLIDRISDSTNCRSFIPPKEFKMPMLTHLMMSERNVNETMKLLKKFRFNIREIDKYPFFRLELAR
uniref:Uncharacterized protein n=2 Tax=viral metagenome TaxID=1070528 RepID=A0A6M3K4T2_9ZZZZ